MAIPTFRTKEKAHNTIESATTAMYAAESL